MSLDVYLETQPCETCGAEAETKWSANITHNLIRMAEEAGIYMAVWRPEECGIVTAAKMIEPLRKGIALLKAEPERFAAFDASNGWGTYRDFVPWLERYLAACERYPQAHVRASR